MTSSNTEQQFWEWFQDHEERLFHFEVFREELLPELNRRLKMVHPALCFGIGPPSEGRREFTVSANGIREGFPAVHALADAHPPLPRWEVVKFRQRIGPLPYLDFEGLRLHSDELRFALCREGPRVGMVVFMAGHEEQQRQHAAFILLDHTLGELDMEMRVGAIRWLPWENAEDYPTCGLAELPEIVDQVLAEGPDPGVDQPPDSSFN